MLFAKTSYSPDSRGARRRDSQRFRPIRLKSWLEFDKQPAEYRDQVLRDRSRVVCIEAGRSDGWYKYVNHAALVIGIDRFGASAPYEAIADHLGFTPAEVAARIREWLG